MVINNCKAKSNNTTLIVGFVVIVALGLLVAFGTSQITADDSTEQDFQTALSIDDDTLKGSEEKKSYQSSNESLGDVLNSSNGGEGSYDVVDTNTVEKANGTQYQIDIEELEDVLNINLDENDEVIDKFWYRTTHELGVTFEGFLVRNVVTGNYDLYYKLGDNVQEITNLKGIDKEELRSVSLLKYFDAGKSTIAELDNKEDDFYSSTDTTFDQWFSINESRTDDYTYLVKSKKSNENIDNIKDIVSLVTLSENNSFYASDIKNNVAIFRGIDNFERDGTTGTYIQPYYYTSNLSISNGETGDMEFFVNGDSSNTPQDFRELYSFAMDEVTQFSKQNIRNPNEEDLYEGDSENITIQTYNLDKFSYVSREQENFTNLTNKYTKIFDEDGFNELYDRNQDKYNSFIQTRYNDLLETTDYINKLGISGTVRTLGEDDVTSITVTNKSRIANITYGEVIQTGQYETNSGYFGEFKMNNDGFVSVIGKQIEGDSFGNYKGDFTISYDGLAKITGEEGYSEILDISASFLTFDFDAVEQYVTDEETNPIFTNEDSESTVLGFIDNLEMDVIGETGSEGQKVARVDIRDGFNLDTEFTYNDEDYQVFNTLQNQKEEVGCMVLDKYTNSTGKYTPASICDEDISMVAQQGQYKIVG